MTVLILTYIDILNYLIFTIHSLLFFLSVDVFIIPKWTVSSLSNFYWLALTSSHPTLTLTLSHYD